MFFQATPDIYDKLAALRGGTGASTSVLASQALWALAAAAAVALLFLWLTRSRLARSPRRVGRSATPGPGATTVAAAAALRVEGVETGFVAFENAGLRHVCAAELAERDGGLACRVALPAGCDRLRLCRFVEDAVVLLDRLVAPSAPIEELVLRAAEEPRALRIAEKRSWPVSLLGALALRGASSEALPVRIFELRSSRLEFLADQPLEAGQAVVVRVSAAGYAEPWTLEGTIASVAPGEGGLHRLGMALDSTPSAGRAGLADFVAPTCEAAPAPVGAGT